MKRPARVGSVLGASKGVVMTLGADLDANPLAALNAGFSRKHEEGGVLREGTLEKRIVGKEIKWAPRHVLLTHDALLFTITRGGQIRDSVQLDDIALCQEPKVNDHALFPNAFEDESKGSPQAMMMSRARYLVDSVKGSFRNIPSLGQQSTGYDAAMALKSEWDNVLEIRTQRYARTYFLRAESAEARDEWRQAIKQAIKHASHRRDAQSSQSLRRKTKLRVRRLVDSSWFQNIISLLLVANFVMNVYDSETMHEEGTQARAFLDLVDSAFTVIYFVELVLNLYAHWFRRFFTSGWFIFDFVVVMFNAIESLVLLVLAQNDNKSLSVIRMVRIFRIVRVFNKLKSLQKVILGISSTLLPMSNIVIVFGIINSIYAILAAKMFMESYPEKFGSFTSSSFSMFQVATGDSWVTDIVYTLNKDETNDKSLVLVFFSSYVVIVGIILFNIIVAVLLEGFLGAIQQKEREEAAKEEKEAMQRAAGALDPLLSSLALFQSPEHLESEILVLFRLLDVDDSGSLSFSEMQEGLESLPLTPPVVMSIEDWDNLTMNGTILDEEECLEFDEFQRAIRWQLMIYGQRMLGQRMKQAIKTKAEDPTQLFALKLCLMQVCAQASPSLDARVEVEMRDVSEASLHKLQDKPTGASLESIDEGQQGPKEGEQDPKPGVQEKLGKTVTEQTDARDFSQLHDQRKLDQILRLVSDSYEKSTAAAAAAEAALQAAGEARNTSRAILQYLRTCANEPTIASFTMSPPMNHNTNFSARKREGQSEAPQGPSNRAGHYHDMALPTHESLRVPNTDRSPPRHARIAANEGNSAVITVTSQPFLGSMSTGGMVHMPLPRPSDASGMQGNLPSINGDSVRG